MTENTLNLTPYGVGAGYWQTKPENNLLPVEVNKQGEQIVDGRELHAFLQIETRYDIWFSRMLEYGFVEGEDFNSFKIERVQIEGVREVKRRVIDHKLTLDMAKELCMIQRNELGRQARRYFIAIEKAYKSYAVARALSKEARRTLTDVIKDCVPESPHKKFMYKNFTDLVYKSIYGKNCKQLKSELGLSKDDNLRDVFSKEELEVIETKEDLVRTLVKSGYSYNEIKLILAKSYITG